MAFSGLPRSQFPQLRPGDVYADWTGAALPPAHLIDAGHKRLRTTLLGNPHSHHGPSMAAMEAVTQTRGAILSYFHASPDEYEVIFTPNASGAILLMQHFVFEGGELLLTEDNHNTVNGLREIARRNGAVARYAPIRPDLTLNDEALRRMLSYPRSSHGNKLFAYPAKSNYAGTVHPLSWVNFAQERGWSVLLDAAAFVANDQLDLSVVKPDFVPISFYKMFGYPTGIGCLIIKKSAYTKLHKKWFSGGTILLVSVAADFYAPEPLGYARYEDGTVNFAMIPSVMDGLRFRKELGDVKPHAVAIATALYDRLTEMREGDNRVQIHSARGNDTVTFSILKGDTVVDAWNFEQAGTKLGCSVRTGCFCNPGVNESVFGYGIESFQAMYNDGIRPEDVSLETLRAHSGGKPIGAVRASFGYANTLEDAARFADVTRTFLRSL